MGDELCGQGTIKVGIFFGRNMFSTGLLSTTLTFGLRIGVTIAGSWGNV